jgi:hypothetical protein
MDKKSQMISGMVAAMVLGWMAFAWLKWPAGQAAEKAPTAQDLVLRCPSCKLEWPYSPDQENKVVPCPKCGPTKGVVLAAVPKKSRGFLAAGGGNMKFIIYLTGAVVWLLFANYCFYVLRPVLKARNKDKDFFIFSCPWKCGRQMGAYPRQAGQPCICPYCKKKLFYPAPGQDAKKAS